MKEKWNHWRKTSHAFDVTCHVLSFPFRMIYRFLCFLLTFSKVILNIVLLVLIVGGIVGGILYAKFLPMYQDASEQAYDKLSNLNRKTFSPFLADIFPNTVDNSSKQR